MKKIHFLLILITVISFFGCSKDDETPEPEPANEFELAPETFIIDDATKNSLVHLDSITVKFNSNTAQLDSLESGDIIVSEISQNAPYGYLRKINSITRNNNTVELSTSLVSLTEAIKNGNASFSKNITVNDIEDVDTSGQEITSRGPFDSELSFEISRTFDLDGNSNTPNDKIHFTGSIDLNPSFQFDIDIDDFALEHFLSKFTFASDAHVNVNYDYSLEQLDIQKSYVLKTIKLKPFTIWIHAFPLVLRPRIVFVAGVDGSVKSEIIIEGTNTYSSELGLEYFQNSGWQTINEHNDVLNGEITLNAEASVEGWLQSRLEIRPYDAKAVKVSLAAKGGFEAKANIDNPTTLNASLKFLASFFGQAQMRVFSSSILDYDHEFWNYEYDIWSGVLDYNPVDITTGLVAYYPFNGNANDESGNNHNGTVYGGATLTADRHGNPNSAYSFDGVNDQINIDDLTFSNTQSSDPIYLSLWVKTETNKPAGGLISYHSACSYDDDDYFHLTLYSEGYAIDNSNELNLHFFDNSNDRIGIPKSEIANNQWHNLVFGYSSGSVKLFLDGNLRESINYDSNYFNEDLRLVIAGFISDNCEVNHNFEGILDDIRVYSRILTENEIQALYNE